MTTACTCPCGRCTGQVAGGHAECPYNCGRSTAWLGQTETDCLELVDLSAYLRQRGPVGGVGVAAAPAPPTDLNRWQGFMVRVSDVPTTVASAGAVPTGGSAVRDPGRTVLGVAPFAIADGDGSFDCCRPGSGKPVIPTAGEPRPVRLAVSHRRSRRMT